VAFRVLAAGNFPKHRTLCDFRALHLQELAALFVQVVKLAGKCGLVKLGTIAVDGTKLRANASKHKAMSHERMQAAEVEFKAQIDALLKRAAQADAREADEPELDVLAEIARREKRLEAIQQARRRLRAMPQRSDRRRCTRPDHRGGRGHELRRRQWRVASDARCGRAQHRPCPRAIAAKRYWTSSANHPPR
jgi:hypothetical protein